MNIYQTDPTKKPEIFTLIREHKNEEAKRYLELNPAEIHLKGWMDDTPLHIASLSGNLEMVEYLLENGAEVNAERSSIYKTPLCFASNLPIAQILLDHGATMNDLELFYATMADKVGIVDLLLASGAGIDQQKPQYLNCSSIECINVYLEYGIAINGCDQNASNLLHKLAWIDRPEVFDFAYKNGCPWQKDSSRRTPYYLAKQGRRENIVQHLREHYAELILNKIEPVEIAEYKFEKILVLKQNPEQPDCFLALTNEFKLIKYLKRQDELVIDKIVKIDVPTIRNFTFDENGNMVVPTVDNKLLVVEPTTLRLLYTMPLEEGLDLDQLEYLPNKNIYVCSSHSWAITLLDADFKLISKTSTDSGTLLPKINRQENLIAFLSYDQDVYYYCLYELTDSLEIKPVETFFRDTHIMAHELGFNDDEFAVLFPRELEYYKFSDGNIDKLWQINFSIHGLGCLVFINPKGMLAGVMKKLYFISTQVQIITGEMQLELEAEIENLFLDHAKEHLIVSTNSELKLLRLKEINWLRPGIV